MKPMADRQPQGPMRDFSVRGDK
eukprot:SAG11_NODE_36433_length_261_cov_1.271605_1_plen_22_part_01